ncbi:hypothetical protein BaRGS_00017924, partial [Batillaria attramentaria]
MQGKTTSLPALPTATPPPGPESQLAQINMFRGKNNPANIRASADYLENEEKMRLLETRLGVTEKSNRALLEEVLRLQNDLRVTVARNEQAIRDEKSARTQLDSSVHIVNDLISQLANRIKAAEEKITEEKSALSTLVTHTKSVEQAVLASQQEFQAKKDSQGNKLMDLQSRVVESQRTKEQLEKTIYNLTDELRAVRNKVEGQQAEFNTIISDLRLRSRRLEEENKLQLDALRKQGDLQSHTDQNTSHLRGQVETRLAELRDVILDLRTRQDSETNDRRALEQALQQRVNELNMALGEQNRKREEAMHAMDMIHREREHAAETEKLKLQSKLTENMEEMNKRLLTKEIKLREEIQEKHLQLEKVIQAEKEKQGEHERKMREDNEKRWAALKKMSDDEMHAIKEALKSERGKSKESVQKLDESISLIEKQLQEQKRQTDKIIAAEIKSRKDHERRTQENIDHVQEKLQVATATLQQAIGGVNGHLAGHSDKMRKEMKGMIEASEQGTTRAMTDMDVRLQSMKQKIGNLEQALDSRVAEATALLAQNIREKVESISLWQDVTSQTIRELNQSIQQMPNDIYAIEEKQKLLKSEMESRVTSEAESRIRDVENLKQEVAMLNQRKTPQAATQQDLQELQGTVRKLAESLQTVKTVLGMKIQSEQKLRISGIEDLQIQINSLKTQVGMHRTVGAIPLYTRSDVDAAFDLDGYLKKDETAGIPYGKPVYGKPLADPGQEAAVGAGVAAGVAYQGRNAGSRNITPTQTGRLSQTSIPHREGRQIFSPRRQTPETRQQMASGVKTPSQGQAPLTEEPASSKAPGGDITPVNMALAAQITSPDGSKTPVNPEPAVKAATPTGQTTPRNKTPAREASRQATPKTPGNKTPAQEPRQMTPKTQRTDRTDGAAGNMFMDADDLYPDTEEEDGWEQQEDEYEDDQIPKDPKAAKAEEEAARRRSKVDLWKRLDDTKRLDDDIDELKKMVKPLVRNPNFVKDDDNDDNGRGRGRDSNEAGVNRWNVYNAY